MPVPTTANATATGSSQNGLYGGIICSVIALLLYSSSFYTTSKFLGTTDNWNDIQSNAMPTILMTALGGGIMMFIACALYFSQVTNSDYITYIILGMSSFALCFSYASLAVSVMTKASA
jgi:hypothetical protein